MCLKNGNLLHNSQVENRIYPFPTPILEYIPSAGQAREKWTGYIYTAFWLMLQKAEWSEVRQELMEFLN